MVFARLSGSSLRSVAAPLMVAILFFALARLDKDSRPWKVVLFSLSVSGLGWVLAGHPIAGALASFFITPMMWFGWRVAQAVREAERKKSDA